MSTNQYLSEDQFEEMERYLANSMSGEEKELFETKMERDEDLREKVEELKLIQLGIEQATLEERLHYFHQNMAPPKIKKIGFRRWLAAASVLVLIAAATFWLLSKSSTENDLFATYFKPDPGLISSMGNSDQYQFDKAMVDYKTGDYEIAITSWKNLQQAGILSDTLDYFIGCAYTAIRNSDSAIIYLQRVKQQPNSSFSVDANWYLGLALILQNKNSEAIEYIKRSSHKDRDKLLSKLSP